MKKPNKIYLFEFVWLSRGYYYCTPTVNLVALLVSIEPIKGDRNTLRLMAADQGRSSWIKASEGEALPVAIPNRYFFY